MAEYVVAKAYIVRVRHDKTVSLKPGLVHACWLDAAGTACGKHKTRLSGPNRTTWIPVVNPHPSDITCDSCRKIVQS